MVRLTVLGTIDLRNSEDHRVESILAQPKRLALLSLIALAGRAEVQRDELVGVLWPALDQEQARHALRQALHFLRRSLGPGVITGKGGNAVGTSSSAFYCDAAAVREALREGRPADALKLYRGELLPGFHIPGGGSEFEHWLDLQRRRMKLDLAKAAWEVAELQENEGNYVAAGLAAKQAYELSDWSENALQRLMRFQLRIGETAGAHAAFKEYEVRLQRELGLSPSAATRDLLREPVDFAAAQSSTDTDQPIDLSDDPDEHEPGGRLFDGIGSNGIVQAALSVVSATAVALVIVSLWGTDYSEGEEKGVAADLEAVHVVPVVDASFPTPAPQLAQAVTQQLLSQLSETGGLKVVVQNQAQGDPTAAHIRIGTTLIRQPDTTSLVSLILDPTSGAVLERASVIGPAISNPTSLSLLVGRLSTQIREKLGFLQASRGLRAPGRNKALALLRQAWSDLKVADSLRAAGVREPALVYYQSADSLLANAAAEDPEWAEPHLRRAELALQRMWLHLIPPHRDLSAAQGEVERGLTRLEPALEAERVDPRALELRGILKSWIPMLTPGAAKDALRQSAAEDLEAVVRVNPSRARAWARLSLLQEETGDFARAYYSARRAYHADTFASEAGNILVRLFITALETGNSAEAEKWCAELRERSHDAWLSAYCELSVAAWMPEAGGTRAGFWYHQVRQLAPEGGQGDMIKERASLLYAVALAKSDSLDRAFAIARVHAGSTAKDPEVLGLKAWLLATAGQPGAAKEALNQIERAHPLYHKKLLKSRRFSSLTEAS